MIKLLSILENVARNHDGKAAPYGSGYEEVDEVRGGLGKWFREKCFIIGKA